MAALQEDLRLMHDAGLEPASGSASVVWILAGLVLAGCVVLLWLRLRGRPGPASQAVTVGAAPDPLTTLDEVYRQVRSPADYARALTAMSLIVRTARGRALERDLAVMTTDELREVPDATLAAWVAEYLGPADAVRFGGIALEPAGFTALYEAARACLLRPKATAQEGEGASR